MECNISDKARATFAQIPVSVTTAKTRHGFGLFPLNDVAEFAILWQLQFRASASPMQYKP